MILADRQPLGFFAFNFMANINRGRYTVQVDPCAPLVGIVGTITRSGTTSPLVRDVFGVYFADRAPLIQHKVVQAIKAQTLGYPALCAARADQAPHSPMRGAISHNPEIRKSRLS